MGCLQWARSLDIRCCGIFGVGLAVLCAIASGQRLNADDQNAQARLSAYLEAGEFGPATELANAEIDIDLRDSMLAEIARAQSQSGATTASLHTARTIRRDKTRSSAFEQSARVPFLPGARGGASLADFDTLIQLIKSTVSPDSWDDAGGVGAAEPFPGGVFVDSRGTLKRIASTTTDNSLPRARRATLANGGNRDARQKSDLRKVSLNRLERMAQMLWAMGERPNEQMQVLAGLTRIQYVFVYPESGDIVIAGPAEDWVREDIGNEIRIVGRQSRRPVLQLDDFVVVLRNALSDGGRFGCSINPRRENLASVHEFLNESSQKSLKPSEREQWLSEIRDRLGPQDIEVNGVDPRTRAARVLVEADYRMKMIGMGLEPGTLGVTSYLDSLDIPAGGSQPPLDVLRWWFTLNYEAMKTTEAHDAFEIVGQGVKVLSENELLTERGERVHTGNATHINRMFTQSFTKQFTELAIKYPIYAELRNIFDMALVGAVIREEDLDGRSNWEYSFFGPQGRYRVELDTAPTQVDSVINHRLIGRKHLVVGVSGGVSVDTSSFVKASALKTDEQRILTANRESAIPPKLPIEAWWWD